MAYIPTGIAFLGFLLGCEKDWSFLMPKALERKLKREAKTKGFGKKRSNAYVYGTLRKLGWKPKRGKK